ncbi:MAG: hypothetical protein HY718_05675, partial [Planctomycetes bacterium]|nr:hypothetical protein [Planctomycetota bacterium]
GKDQPVSPAKIDEAVIRDWLAKCGVEITEGTREEARELAQPISASRDAAGLAHRLESLRTFRAEEMRLYGAQVILTTSQFATLVSLALLVWTTGWVMIRKKLGSSAEL